MSTWEKVLATTDVGGEASHVVTTTTDTLDGGGKHHHRANCQEPHHPPLNPDESHRSVKGAHTDTAEYHAQFVTGVGNEDGMSRKKGKGEGGGSPGHRHPCSQLGFPAVYLSGSKA